MPFNCRKCRILNRTHSFTALSLPATSQLVEPRRPAWNDVGARSKGSDPVSKGFQRGASSGCCRRVDESESAGISLVRTYGCQTMKGDQKRGPSARSADLSPRDALPLTTRILSTLHQTNLGYIGYNTLQRVLRWTRPRLP